MYKICVFAGTTEGRKLVDFLNGQSAFVTACVATEYGEALLGSADNLTVLAGRMTRDEMINMLSETCYDLVIDATHPYAVNVTDNISYACNVTGTEYIRLLREKSQVSANEVFVSDVASAVEFLNTTKGNILLTTGIKDLPQYIGIHGFEDRVYARVLPTEYSLEACSFAGLKPSHIIAMQGPFSEEMNAAMLNSLSAKYMITKDSGEAGGFDNKVKAVKRTGTILVVIGRPLQREGLSFSETVEVLCSRFDCVYRPYAAIVGIGPGNNDAMTCEVCSEIKQADCIIGARRMLDLTVCNGQNEYEAIAPDKISGFIMNHKEYQRFAIVMSGDVGFYSGAKKLIPLLDKCEVKVLPGLNSLAYLCARLKMSYENIPTVSLHGRDCDIIPYVRENYCVFALLGGEKGVNDLCYNLINNGLEQVKIYVGERLSYRDEKITSGTARELADGIYDALSVALIENNCSDEVITYGLPDNAFLRITGIDERVPMTKSEVRSVCLSKLRIAENSVCWDVGAGTGAVAVEMARYARKGMVYAIERKESAAKLIQCNKDKFSLNNMTIISGTAPEICSGLPIPDRVFIGGSSGNMREIISYLIDINPYVRIVATAVSL